MSATLTTEFGVTRQVLLTFLRMFHPRCPTPTLRRIQGCERGAMEAGCFHKEKSNLLYPYHILIE